MRLILIPILDGVIVFRLAGLTFAPIILVHWGTAALILTIIVGSKIGKLVLSPEKTIVKFGFHGFWSTEERRPLNGTAAYNDLLC